MDNSSAPQFFAGKERNPAEDIRIELGQYAARLMQRGLTSATGGNISHRDGEDMWITPSGCRLDEVELDDWVRVNIETGEVYPHRYKPSSEVVMHRRIFQERPDVNAIMHSHPPYVIALSLLGVELTPIGSESPISLGENVPLIPYEIPTSPLLAAAVAPYARQHDVMVLENHGLIALGSNNRQAYNRTELAEEIARILAIAYSLGKGEPRKPSQEEIDEYKRWFYHRQLPERP